jgi:hypothetical protein
LTSLFAVSTIDKEIFDKLRDFKKRVNWFESYRKKNNRFWPNEERGDSEEILISLVQKDRLIFLLNRLLHEDEFLSVGGIRALSKYHKDNPYSVSIDGVKYTINYDPGDSTSNLFGRNSNWRGPVWMPVNFLIIQALREYHLYYGNSFQVECPTGSGHMMTLEQVAKELGRLVSRIFLRDKDGKRPVFGGNELFNGDPHWRDYVPFYEYFHGDNGRGCGASHQTGWTGLIAQVLVMLGKEMGGHA